MESSAHHYMRAHWLYVAAGCALGVVMIATMPGCTGTAERPGDAAVLADAQAAADSLPVDAAPAVDAPPAVDAVSPHPDLLVTAVSLVPESPMAGDEVVFAATVANQGGAATPAGTILGVLFRVDGTPVAWSDTHVEALLPGATVQLFANGGPGGDGEWLAAGGSHTVAARVDDIDRIYEGNEDNNQLEAPFVVRQKPSAATTGVPAGVTLTPHYGDITITEAGTVLDSLDIYGRVNVRAANVTIRRCRIRGKQTQPEPDEWIALVNAASASCSDLLVEDCEIAPTYPSAGANGIQGYRFTSRRNNIHDVVDGLGMMGTDPCRSEADYIHDLSFFSPDPNHSDNQTHNDCIQFHSGGNHVVVGSFLSGFVSLESGTGNSPVAQAMSCLMVNESAGLMITNNWMEGGYYPVNAGDSDNVGLDLGTFWRNRFDGARNEPPNFDVTPPFSIVVKTGAVADTGAGTANANRFYDNSEVLVRYY